MKDYVAGYSRDEWKKLEREFRSDYEKSKKYNKPFREMIRDILDGETDMSFTIKTGLSPNMLSRLRNQIDETDRPQKNTIISVCVGYNLDIMMAQSLLDSVGSGLSRFNLGDYAYSFILTRCRGKSIDECNEILKQLGVRESDRLGCHARKSRNI